MSLRKVISNFFKKGVIQENGNYEIISEWVKGDKQMPPPHLVKQLAIKNEKAASGCNILVETGTYFGDMVEAQKPFFEKVYSIELGEELYSNAAKRFEEDKNVFILKGDSGVILYELMPEIFEPTIFWLDGHYSAGITVRGEKECPIFEELTAIFGAKELNHIILIDDARLFNGTNDYPSVKELVEFIEIKNKKFSLTIKEDIIRIAKTPVLKKWNDQLY